MAPVAAMAVMMRRAKVMQNSFLLVSVTRKEDCGAQTSWALASGLVTSALLLAMVLTQMSATMTAVSGLLPPLAVLTCPAQRLPPTPAGGRVGFKKRKARKVLRPPGSSASSQAIVLQPAVQEREVVAPPPPPPASLPAAPPAERRAACSWQPPSWAPQPLRTAPARPMVLPGTLRA
eukprot:241826-Hanusia_phi.AAC.2